MKNSKSNTIDNQLSSIETVVLAVGQLGGSGRSIDTEDVAVQCNELVPGMFAWRKYPQQINLELVRVALSDAKKEKNGGLLIGSGREGWRLSERGLSWFQQSGPEPRASAPDWTDDRRSAGSIDVVRKEREKRRIVGTQAWAKWSRRDSVTRLDAMQVFRIDEYSNAKIIEIKIVRLKSLFESEDEIVKFLADSARILESKE